MKRKNLLAAAIIAAGVTQAVSAAGAVSVTVNNQKLSFDRQPIISNDRVLVPVRKILESLGAEVSWDEAQSKVTCQNDNTVVEMIIGQNVINCNGQPITLDTAPCISGDRTMVPIRALSECFGAFVKWDGSNNNVIIDTNKKPDNNVGTEAKPETTPEVKPEATPDTNVSESSFAYKVFELVNAERAKNGLTKLSWSNDLASVAYAHSVDMSARNYMSHTNPDGLSPFDRIKNYGISYRSAAENIAAGQATPESVMNSWMNSAGHRQNILNPSFTKMGAGYFSGSGQYTHYWTQCFISQ